MSYYNEDDRAASAGFFAPPTSYNGAVVYAAPLYIPPPPSRGCCCSRAPVSPLTDALSASRALASAFAGAAVGLGAFGIITCGWSLISSVLVVGMASVLLHASRDGAAFAALVGEVTATSSPRWCAGRRPRDLRGLAIAVIVFAVLELGVGLGVGFGLGASQIVPATSLSWVSRPPYYIEVCGKVQSYDSVQTCLFSSFNASYGTATWRRQLDLHDDTMVQAGAYLFYGGGATIVQSIVKVALAAVTLQIVDVLKSLSLGLAAAPSSPGAAIAPAKGA